MTHEKLLEMGNKKADVLVVCDPPSAWLWQTGLPIGGDAIKLFSHIAEECGFSKDDFYFVSPCPPIPEEIESSDKRINDFVNPYREQVLDTIRRIDPAIVVYLGKWAGRIVMGRPQQIMKVRGSFTDTDIPGLGRVPVLPMLSPGHVLRRPEMRDIFRTDFYMLERLRDLDWNLKRIVETAAGKKDYRWCTDLSELTKLNPTHISVDTETTGLTWYTCGTDDPNAVKILTVQIGYAPGKAFCVPVDCAYYPDLTPKKREKLVGQLKALLEDPAIKKAGHNMKYDTHVLREDLGIYIDYATDTQLLAFVVDENMQEKSLDECVRRWVPALAGYNDALNKKLDKSNMRSVSHDDMLNYGCGDADASYRLAVALTQLAKADKKQWRCYQKIIFPAIKAFCDPVEFYGIRVNTKVLSQLQKDLQVTERELYANLIEQVPPAIKRKHAEKGLKFTRDAFTRDILFSRQGLKLVPKVFTKSTAKLPPDQRIPSVSTKQHLPYFQDEPFVAQLMEYIKLQKLRGTYVGVPFDEEKGAPTGFWKYVYNGEIHPSFMLHRVVTGRSSSEAPNCFPGHVEVLTERGWYRFDSVPDGLNIAQYDFGTGYIDFAKPDGFIERRIDNGFLREIKTTQHIDIVCTEDHRFTLKNRKTGAWREVTAVNYGRDALQPHSGFHHSGTLHYTPAQITLICALQADAHIMRDGGHLDWAFRKARKAERLEAALIAEGIPYRIHSKGGRFRFYVSRKNIPDYLRDKKQFGQWVLDLTAPSLHCFCDELMFWDGDYTRGMSWTTINKTDADWVQLAYTLSGKRALITQRQNSTCREFYVVNVADTAYSHTANHTNERIPYSGNVYCFTMPKDSLVVRHNGRVHIVNNSQNFPKRGKLAKTYRKIFQARPGYVLLESDISQAELRIAAWMANEKTMLKIYREGGDIHAMTAAHTMGLSLKQFMAQEEEVIEQKRFQAKAINFGFCVSKDTLILTLDGEKKIVDIKPTDLLWDGYEWVTHDGVVHMGKKEVITYDGLTATTDHKVFIGDTEKVTLKEAAERGLRILKTGEGDKPITLAWTGSSSGKRKDTTGVQTHSSFVKVHLLRGRKIQECSQYTGATNFGMSVPGYGQVDRRPAYKVARISLRQYGTAVLPGYPCKFSQLQRARDQGVVSVSGSLHKMGTRYLPEGEICGEGFRQNRQQRGLLPGKSSFGFKERKRTKQIKYCEGFVGRGRSLPKTLVQVFLPVHGAKHLSNGTRWDVSRGDCAESCEHSIKSLREVAQGMVEAGKKTSTPCGEASPPHSPEVVDVYDILNAGPRHRFTANGKLVSNCYGMGWRKFKTYAKTDYGLDFTDQQAEQLREAFFALYPGLVDWHESTRAWVREKGYVRALHGAIRHLPSITSSEDYIRQECERQAVNAPVQRFASDLGLMAMIRLTRDANPEDIRPLMFVHDALVVEVREEYAEDAMSWIKFYMESPPLKQWFNLTPPVPIIADLARGYNLGEMDKCKGVKAVAPDWYKPEYDQ